MELSQGNLAGLNELFGQFLGVDVPNMAVHDQNDLAAVLMPVGTGVLPENAVDVFEGLLEHEGLAG